MMQFSHEPAYEEACRKGELPGAVLVATDATGKFRYAKAFGETAHGEKLSVDSVMWIASCTKLMTSVAVLQQVERGNIGLEDDVATLLPELAAAEVLDGFDSEGKPVLKKREEKITLRLLLTYSSGTAYDFIDPGLQRLAASAPTRAKPARTVVEDFNQPLVFQPGHGWAYGPGLDWVGKIVERLTGLTLGEYMRANIWEPLGMKHIGFDPDAPPEMKRRKVGMSIRSGEDGSGRVVPTTEGYLYPYTERDDRYGGAGVWCSAESFLALLRTLCANDGRVLGPALADEMFRPQLGAAAKAAVNRTLKTVDFARRVYGNAFDVDRQEFDFGLGGAIGLRGEEGGRRAAGTLSWGGAPNLIWWIDRRTGLCGAVFTQLLPVGDADGNKRMALFEKSIYEEYEKFLAGI